MEQANFIYPIAFASFVVFCFRVASKVSYKSLTDIALTAFIVFCGSIIVTGFVLSELHLTNNRRIWAWAVFIPAFVFYLQFTKLFGRQHEDNYSGFEVIGNRLQFFGQWFNLLSTYWKVLYISLISSFLVIAGVNLSLVSYTVPNEWDSMTGHLVRLMYYLQHGNMNHFGGTNWNIDTYPKSICNIQIYTYLMSGHIENYFKFIHFSSYFVCVVGAFGIVQRLSNNFSASLFAGLAMGLLPNVLMQAITTETDIVLCAYLSCLTYFLLTYKGTHKRRYLYLAGITFGIVYGHKITFTLLLPSVAMIILYVLTTPNSIKKEVLFSFVGWKIFYRTFKHLFVAIVLGICLFMLPTGYITNMKVFGHPIGPPTALKHQSIERAGDLRTWAGRKNLIKQGSRNVIRYGFDFFNLDGLRNAQWGYDLNKAIKRPFITIERKSGLRLEEETNFTIIPFTFDRRFEFYNANPYYGILGFGLILPLLLLVLIGVIRSKVHLFLAIAFCLHLAALSFSAAYDPWKGRYFQNTAVFAIPFLALIFDKKYIENKVFQAYLMVVVLIACLSGYLTIFLNERALPLGSFGRPSAYKTERIALQTWARPDITKAYQRFDSIVPTHTAVALADINDDFEYPLFGKDLTRKLIPINPFGKGLQPIPKEADYLFFAKSVIKPQRGDIRLGTDTTMTYLITKGEDYYLRKLK
jgi:Dolichyl-phosphate-mannose-protein mannosyltransferase